MTSIHTLDQWSSWDVEPHLTAHQEQVLTTFFRQYGVVSDILFILNGFWQHPADMIKNIEQARKLYQKK